MRRILKSNIDLAFNIFICWNEDYFNQINFIYPFETDKKIIESEPFFPHESLYLLVVFLSP